MAGKEIEMRIRISLVEDDPCTRENLVALFRAESGLEVIGAHSTGEEALEQVPKESPDVLLMDLRLPGIGGVEVVRRLRASIPNLNVLMLTTYEETQIIFEALRAGACGYLLKNRPLEELIDGIREVNAGGSPMSMRIARKVVSHFHERQNIQSGTESLSDREMQVLKSLAAGSSYKDICDVLGISINTLRTHIRRIYIKLQVSSRFEAVARLHGKW
jgi:DNA-binding NarL/FixJ family response regulator